MHKHLLSILLTFTTIFVFNTNSVHSMDIKAASIYVDHFHPGYCPGDGSMYFTPPVFNPPMPAPNPFAILAYNESNRTEEELLEADCFKNDNCGQIAQANINGITPLHIAIHKGYKKLAAKFFAALCDENKSLVLHTQDFYGNTPFHLAMHKSFLGLAQEFFYALTPIQRGEVFRLQDQYDRSVLHLLFRKLHIALIEGWSKEVQYALLNLAVKIVPCSDTSDFIVKRGNDGSEWGVSARTYYNKHLAAPLSAIPSDAQARNQKKSKKPTLKDLANLLNEQMYMPTIRTIDEVPNIVSMFETARISGTASSSLPVSPSQLVPKKSASNGKTAYSQVVAFAPQDRTFEIVEEASKSQTSVKAATAQSKDSADEWTLVPYTNGKTPHQQQVAESKEVSDETVAIKSSKKKSKPSHATAASKDRAALPKSAINDVLTLSSSKSLPPARSSVSEKSSTVVPNGQSTEVKAPEKAAEKPALSPHEQLSEAIRNLNGDDLPGLKKILKTYAKLLTSWRSPAGETMLYAALKNDLIEFAEAIADACPALITTQNSGSDETAITFILKNGATNKKIGHLLPQWDLYTHINLDAPYKGKRTLRNLAEEAKVLQTAEEREAEVKRATAATTPRKKTKGKKGTEQSHTNAASDNVAAKEQSIKFLAGNIGRVMEAIENFDLSVLDNPEYDFILKNMPFSMAICNPKTRSYEQVRILPQDYYGALLNAIELQNVASIRFLLFKIDHLNAKLAPTDETVLTWALQTLCTNTDVSVEKISDIMQTLCLHRRGTPGKQVDLSLKNGSDLTLLHLAASIYPYGSFLQFLLDLGADPTITATRNNLTPLDSLLSPDVSPQHWDRMSDGAHRLVVGMGDTYAVPAGKIMSKLCMYNHKNLLKVYLQNYPGILTQWVEQEPTTVIPTLASYAAHNILERLCDVAPEFVAQNLLKPFEARKLAGGQCITHALMLGLQAAQSSVFSPPLIQNCKLFCTKLLALAPLEQWQAIVPLGDKELTFLVQDHLMDYQNIGHKGLRREDGLVIPVATSW